MGALLPSLVTTFCCRSFFLSRATRAPSSAGVPPDSRQAIACVVTLSVFSAASFASTEAQDSTLRRSSVSVSSAVASGFVVGRCSPCMESTTSFACVESMVALSTISISKTTVSTVGSFPLVKIFATSSTAVGAGVSLAAFNCSRRILRRSCNSVVDGPAFALAAAFAFAFAFAAAFAAGAAAGPFWPAASRRASSNAHSAISSIGGCCENGTPQQWHFGPPPQVDCLLWAALQASLLHSCTLPFSFLVVFAPFPPPFPFWVPGHPLPLPFCDW